MYKKILIFGDKDVRFVLLNSQKFRFFIIWLFKNINDIRIDITDHKGVRNLLNKINLML